MPANWKHSIPKSCSRKGGSERQPCAARQVLLPTTKSTRGASFGICMLLAGILELEGVSGGCLSEKKPTKGSMLEDLHFGNAQ